MSTCRRRTIQFSKIVECQIGIASRLASPARRINFRRRFRDAGQEARLTETIEHPTQLPEYSNKANRVSYLKSAKLSHRSP